MEEIMPQPMIYLFAETPRAGLHHHVTLLPQQGEVPDGLGERLSAVREKSAHVGNDFIGVSQEALQADTCRWGREILLVTVPGCDISRVDTRRIIDKLKELQPKLAELVTNTIDWTKEIPAGSLQRPELDVWQQELAQLFPNDLPKSPTNDLPKKGCWIMRHKLLCIIVTILIVLVAFLKTISGQGLDSLECPNINPGQMLNDWKNWFSGNSNGVDSLQSWLEKLNLDAKQADDNQRKESLRKHLSLAFAKKEPEPDLQTLLRNLQTCFGLTDKKESQLDDLLKDEKLRDKVAELYKNGEVDPLAFVVDDNDEKTPWFHLRQDKSASATSRLKENRQIFLAAVEVQKAAQHKNFQANNQDPWIQFAKQLSFMESGNDVSAPLKEITELEPQFVTETDIAVAKQIFVWLTGDDANAVLKGDSPSNYNEAVQRLAKWKINVPIFDPMNGKPIPEKQSLKDALEELQKSALAL
ncbi:MAG: hypothetical protein LBU65_13100 [Planctomycetaceae bacterium]|jgi:hypothetical protein|nr:hypothetical protein [Planctomycetaceae bacterium]